MTANLRLLDHVGFATSDLEATRTFFSETLGASVTEPITDTVQKVRICFARFTGGTVELVAPAGENSPIDQALKKGGGCYHLCFATDDIEATVERLRKDGCLPLNEPVPAPALSGRRICFLFSREARLIELVEAIHDEAK